jgi:hypothetical protein
MNVAYLSRFIPIKSNLKSPFESLYGEKPTLHNYLKIFGKVEVVTTKDKYRPS